MNFFSKYVGESCALHNILQHASVFKALMAHTAVA